VSLTRWPFRIVASPDEDAAVELYDLEADPGEQTNLAAGDPRLAGELRAQLDATVRAGPAAGLTVEVELEDLQLQ
jgi:hypothetical protein